MKLALFLVVAVGVGIGASMPAPVARPTPTAAPVAPTAEQDAEPRETVLERSPAGHFYAYAEVNGAPVRFLVDTGASVVALSEEDARRAGLLFDTGLYRPIGHGASGVVRGQEVRLDRIALDGKRAADLRAVVVEGAQVSLLGQNYLRGLDVRIKGDRMTLR